MARVRFGDFLPPHHPVGEHPMANFDEFWCGEHHSTGWEMTASPELRTQRSKLFRDGANGPPDEAR